MLALTIMTVGTSSPLQPTTLFGVSDLCAFAAATPSGGQEAPGLMDFIPLMVMIWLVMYFMVIRPQKKQTQEHEQLISDLRKHSEVRTAGGIIGKVALVDRDQGHVVLIIDESKGVRMKVALTSIASATNDSEQKDTPSTIKEEETTK
ncbi:MAG: preprotein translocase subunit YajC [Planctomycetia bacterium TMED53]|nr:MAG: preprotein translocase subunit YajC [Planctomycetia bacterium TMED53]